MSPQANAHVATRSFLSTLHDSDAPYGADQLAGSRFKAGRNKGRSVLTPVPPGNAPKVKFREGWCALCIGFLLSVSCTLSGCAANSQSLFYVPKVMTEKEKQAALFRAEAQYQMTGKITDGRLAHIDPKARIKLKPTPGGETIYEAGQETLTSMPSGGYFAFISQVPITKYFTIVRRADCNEWGTYSPLSAEGLTLFKEQILTGQYRRDKPWYSCLSEFDAHYAAGDARLKDADGAIFDLNSTRIDRNAIHWTLFTNNVKILMNGWAIKFTDPTPEQINEQLKIIPSDRDVIGQLQFKTLIYWIEANKATHYVAQMLALLPINDRNRGTEYWYDPDQAILRALGRIAADSIPIDVWMSVIEKGKHPGWPPIATPTGDAMNTAANILVCRKEDKKELVRRFTAVITGPYPFAHIYAAATALRTMGFADVVEKNRGRDGSLLWKATSGKKIFQCPFSRTSNAV